MDSRGILFIRSVMKVLPTAEHLKMSQSSVSSSRRVASKELFMLPRKNPPSSSICQHMKNEVPINLYSSILLWVTFRIDALFSSYEAKRILLRNKNFFYLRLKFISLLRYDVEQNCRILYKMVQHLFQHKLNILHHSHV
jgi:hypothetical protein